MRYSFANLKPKTKGDKMSQHADTSLTGFYKVMNPKEKKTFWGCFLGWALDGMDFMIYPLVIGTIIAVWQVDRGMAGLAVTGTLLASAFGGWFAGYSLTVLVVSAPCNSPYYGSLVLV
jgi:hypothetical protein